MQPQMQGQFGQPPAGFGYGQNPFGMAQTPGFGQGVVGDTVLGGGGLRDMFNEPPPEAPAPPPPVPTGEIPSGFIGPVLTAEQAQQAPGKKGDPSAMDAIMGIGRKPAPEPQTPPPPAQQQQQQMTPSSPMAPMQQQMPVQQQVSFGPPMGYDPMGGGYGMGGGMMRGPMGGYGQPAMGYPPGGNDPFNQDPFATVGMPMNRPYQPAGMGYGQSAFGSSGVTGFGVPSGYGGYRRGSIVAPGPMGQPAQLGQAPPMQPQQQAQAPQAEKPDRFASFDPLG